VDDSSSIISTTDIQEPNNYIEDYFKILESFYNINKLTLNSDKTKFMIMCKPYLQKQTYNIKLHTTQCVIEQSNKVKILGIYITYRLYNEATINNMVSKINFRLNILKKVIRYTNFQTSRMLMLSIVLSHFQYGSLLLIKRSSRSFQKLTTILLKCTHPILGFISYKWSKNKIMNILKWQTFYHTITHESITFIQKCIF